MQEKENLIDKQDEETSSKWKIASLVTPIIAVLSITLASICIILIMFFVIKSLKAPYIVSKNKLIQKSQEITIEYGNIPPSPHNWIGSFTPPETPDLYPFQRFPIEKTEGKLKLYIVNGRKDFEIRLFINSTSQVLKSTIKVDENYPTQGRIELTNDPTEMNVNWVSNSNKNPIVLYRKEGETDFKQVTAVSDTYKRDDMVDAPANQDYSDDGEIKYKSRAWWEPGYLHLAVLKNLQTNTRYFYKFGSKEYGVSEEFSFISAKPSNSTEITFIVFGDLGSFPDAWPSSFPPSYGTNATLNSLTNIVKKEKIDMILHIGDISCKIF